MPTPAAEPVVAPPPPVEPAPEPPQPGNTDKTDTSEKASKLQKAKPAKAAPASRAPAKPAPPPKKKAARPAVPAPKPAAKPKPLPEAVKVEPPAVESAPAEAPPVEAAPVEAAPPQAPPVEAAPAPPPQPAAPSASVSVPQPGTRIAAADIERWKHLLGPSLQWALKRSATLEAAATEPIPMEAARAQATERYHDQVELSADKTTLKNFVAGIPFPFLTPEDPDAAVKVMFNQQARMIVDDVDVRNVACQIGPISAGSGMALERQTVVGHWRRLYYVGRLYQQPKPIWNTPEAMRHREVQHPFIEPFDLKSAGLSYTRYLDAGRPDDAWLYYPLTRRVRRFSTAQRSVGILGQDMDLDSYTGFAGNPAWSQWRMLGTKTVLAPMHARHRPIRWQQGPGDFLFDDVWEPREVFVVEGVSRLPEYAYGKRVIYVDRESFLVPYTELYDLHGTLWKALFQAWAFGREVRADAGGLSFEAFYLPGYSMVDMQMEHATHCALPSQNTKGEKSWFYNYGGAEGTSEEAFEISNFIGEAH